MNLIRRHYLRFGVLRVSVNRSDPSWLRGLEVLRAGPSIDPCSKRDVGLNLESHRNGGVYSSHQSPLYIIII